MTRSCWKCGCTEDRACPGGCSWVGPRICSACEIKLGTPREQRWTMTFGVHLDGPKGKRGWFGDIFWCNQEPRLARMTRAFRATRTTVISWLVDGAERQGGIYCALERLNAPPVVTSEELPVLAAAPTEYLDLRKSPDLMVLLRLRDKGLVQFEAGKCRRTLRPYCNPEGELTR